MIYKTLTLLFWAAATTFSQAQSSPKILIISPNQSNLEKSLEQEISQKVKEDKEGIDFDKAYKFLNSAEFEQRPENVQILQRSEIDYLKTLDQVKIVSYLAEQHLTHPLFKKFKLVVIKLKDVRSSGHKSDLHRIATEEDMSMVLNFSSFELYKEKGNNFAKLTVQLYDLASETILLDKTYIGDASNPGFEYACDENSVDCCINNALSQALKEVKALIIDNDPATQKAKQLANERSSILDTYLKQPFNKQAVKSIIPASDPKVVLDNTYQAIFSEDKTKCVIFFAEPVPAGKIKAFQDQKDDRDVNVVISNEQVDFTGKSINMYTHIVKAVKYQGKWYYEKAEASYFEASSLEEGQKVFFNYLQKWNFFVGNTATVNPGFWESTGKTGRTLVTTTLFEKVPDLTKDPDWEKKKEYLKTTEKENRPYVGMYEIVADQLKAEKEKSGK